MFGNVCFKGISIVIHHQMFGISAFIFILHRFLFVFSKDP